MKVYISEYQVFVTTVNRIPVKYTSTIEENCLTPFCSVFKSVLDE